MGLLGKRCAPGVLLVLALLGTGACGSDDSQPYCDPCEPPPCTGCSSDPAVLTLVTENIQIPADGATITNARASLTDDRGIALANVPIRFTADLPEVRWVHPSAEDAATECIENTGVDGVVSCAFRAPPTPGRAEVSAVTLDSLGLGAVTVVDFVH